MPEPARAAVGPRVGVTVTAKRSPRNRSPSNRAQNGTEPTVACGTTRSSGWSSAAASGRGDTQCVELGGQRAQDQVVQVTQSPSGRGRAGVAPGAVRDSVGPGATTARPARRAGRPVDPQHRAAAARGSHPGAGESNDVRAQDVEREGLPAPRPNPGHMPGRSRRCAVSPAVARRGERGMAQPQAAHVPLESVGALAQHTPGRRVRRHVQRAVRRHEVGVGRVEFGRPTGQSGAWPDRLLAQLAQGARFGLVGHRARLFGVAAIEQQPDQLVVGGRPVGAEGRAHHVVGQGRAHPIELAHRVAQGGLGLLGLVASTQPAGPAQFVGEGQVGQPQLSDELAGPVQ